MSPYEFPADDSLPPEPGETGDEHLGIPGDPEPYDPDTDIDDGADDDGEDYPDDDGEPDEMDGENGLPNTPDDGLDDPERDDD